MRRLGASFALAFFLTTPVMQWRCVIACADEDTPATAHIHQCAAASNVPNLAGNDDCDQHSSPVAVVSGTRQLALDWLAVSVAVLPVTDRPVVASVWRAATARPPDRPPDHAAPLRI